MLGAIAGDIIGSVYEFNNVKTKNFPLFCEDSSYTDDTIMTVAVADWLMYGGDLATTMQHYGKTYPWEDSLSGYTKRIQNPTIVGEMVLPCV